MLARARYGGEEFVMLLPNTEKQHAIDLAEECRERIIELGIPHNSSTVFDVVTISAGVSSIVPAAGILPSSLINTADAALYQAKNNGRNRVANK
ncbi:diguanylate cyclase domain-containing protein [Pseudomonadota bacterium]